MAHGRYTIVGKLADGGMAEIFLAMQHGAEGFQKPVVLKRVLTAFSADPQFRNMFLDEAHISMRLRHGNIVEVLDVGVAGERAFLVLELVEGWDLEQIMVRAQATGPEHPWPPSLALYVTAQICRALSYAHAQRGPDGRSLGIVHRDVSPNNVLISEQGDVKLADFGIAKAESKREQTLAGVIKGKIGFMSPEQALGRPLYARADLFSVGTVMYLMLTGRRPFHAASELESMMLAQRAEYQPPEDLNPYLSPEATAIVRRAMQRDAADRYQSADEMLVDVERVLRGQYHSAGQTELKMWLADLGRRDGMAPVGRLRPEEGARPEFVDETGDLSAGSSLELSDFDRNEATVAAAPTVVAMPGATPISGAATPSERPHLAAGVTPYPPQHSPPARTPVTGPTQPVRVTTPSHSVAAAAPAHSAAPAARPHRRWRLGLGFILGAICMLGTVFGIRWLAQWAGRERPGIAAWYQAPSDTSSVSANSQTALPSRPPVPLSDARDGNGLIVASVGASGGASASASTSGRGESVDSAAPPGVASAVTLPPSSHSSASDAGTGEVTNGDPETDEDRLLGHVVPNASTVIGEDEAEDSAQAKVALGKGSKGAKDKPGSPTAAASEDSSKGSGKPSRSSPTGGSARTQPVQVRISSSPLGAVVRTKKHVLGRTPLAVRFSPGSTYELTFVKSGYVTNSRRLLVAAGKPKSISVAMKKVAAPVRHGLFRGR